MQYKPKSIAALHVALGGLPDKMRVQVDSDIRLSAKTVGQLRKVKVWPEDLVITTPQQRQPKSVVKVSKASTGTRYPPKR
jgi:translation initiation factor IF-1